MTSASDTPEPETDLSRFGYDDVSGLIVDNTHATGEPFKFDVSDEDEDEDEDEPEDA